MSLQEINKSTNFHGPQTPVRHLLMNDFKRPTMIRQIPVKDQEPQLQLRAHLLIINCALVDKNKRF